MEKRHKASACQLQSIFLHGQGLILFNTLFIMLTGMYSGVVQRIYFLTTEPSRRGRQNSVWLRKKKRAGLSSVSPIRRTIKKVSQTTISCDELSEENEQIYSRLLVGFGCARCSILFPGP